MVTLNGMFTDPGILDTHTVVINWGDGSTNTTLNLAANVLTFNAMHQYLQNQPNNAPYQVMVTVTDKDGGSTNTTAPFTVLNVAPSGITLNFFNNADNTAIDATHPLPENGTARVDGTFTDPGTLDSHQVTIDWGDGSPVQTLAILAPGTLNFSATHQYLDNQPQNQPFPVTVTVRDLRSTNPNVFDGGIGTASQDMPVVNVAPTVTPGTISLQYTDSVGTTRPINATNTPSEGDLVSLAFDFTDPGTLDTFTLTVNWGDGTTTTYGVGRSPAAKHFTATHTYLDNSAGVNVTTTLVDKDGGSTTQPGPFTFAVKELLHVSPSGVAGADFFDPQTGFTGIRNRLIATFTDAGRAHAASDYSATVTWGDGTTSTTSSPVTVIGGVTVPQVQIVASTQVVNGVTIPIFQVLGSHLYLAPSTYAICVSVSENTDAAHSMFMTSSPTIAALGNNGAQNLLSRILQDRANVPLEGNVFTQVVQSNAAKITLSQDPIAAAQNKANAIRILLNSEQFFIRSVRDLYLKIFRRDPVATNAVGVALLSDPSLVAPFNGGLPYDPSAGTVPQAVLQRSVVVYADPGAQHWVQFLAQGGSIDFLRAMLLGSGEFRTVTVPRFYALPGVDPTMQYVNALYRVLLGRSAFNASNQLIDPGLLSWVNQLNMGANGTTVAFNIQASTEGRHIQLVRIYQMYLGRSLDAVGEAGFTRLLNLGGSENQVIQAIVNSDEYAQRVTLGINILNC
jgi:hypothetical protein